MIVTDHMKHIFSNSEYLWSKINRKYYHPPPKSLLPGLSKSAMSQMGRTIIIDVDTILHIEWQRHKGFIVSRRPYFEQFFDKWERRRIKH